MKEVTISLDLFKQIWSKYEKKKEKKEKLQLKICQLLVALYYSGFVTIVR
jgi:ArsR family metal-binding transcriptional regulator